MELNGCEVCECDYIGERCPYCERKQLRDWLIELFAADDAYGCGFYSTPRWREAYRKLRLLVGKPDPYE